MAGAADSDCPACGARTDDDPWCGVCGLDLRGDEAGLLRHLAGVLSAAEVELAGVRARRDAIATELAERKLAAGRFFEPPPAAEPLPVFAPRPMPRATRAEWGVDRVRNFLLWTGATLLVLSALAFTAVAWTHLGPVGRAVLLVAFTGVSAGLASGTRHRLPASSGALTGLTIALALVDWQVARRAGGSGSMSGAAWWAIGTAVVGALSAGLARIAAPVPARRAIAGLGPAAAVLTVIAVGNAAWSWALGFALVAGVLAAVDRFVGARLTDRVVRTALPAAAAAVWAVGAVLAIAAAFGPSTVVQTFTPAAVMLALAVTPGLGSFGRRPITTITRVNAFLVMAAGIGAALILASSSVGPVGLATLAVALGSVVIAVAPSLDATGRAAAYGAGAAAAAAGFVLAFVEAAVCELGPLAWFGHAWQGTTHARALAVVVGPHTTGADAIGWCAVAILATAAAAIAIASVPQRGQPLARSWRAAAGGLALAAIVVGPIAAGATVLVVLVVATTALVLALVGSGLASGRYAQAALASGVLAVIPAAPLAGWASVTRGTSVSVLATVVVGAFVAAAVGRQMSLRAAHAGLAALATIALAPVVTLASGGSRPVAGFVGAVVAGMLLLAGTSVRHDTIDGLVVECTGGAGVIFGVLLAVPSLPWMAAALTTMVPLLLTASARRSRNLLYGGAAGAAALGATWMWLAAAGVTLVEAYTLPAAALAFAAGTFVSERVRGWSWLSLGSAIVLVLAPTVGLAIVRHDDGRAIASGVAALAIAFVGARRQLQAPLVLGVIALLALGVDKISPQAVRLPRWVMLAIAGALLLWVGTTFERRRDEMYRAARRLGGLR